MIRTASRCGASALLVALSALSLHAQTFSNSDPVLKKIWDLGMNQSKTWELSQALFDSVGPRLYGSPAAIASSNWIIGKYKSWGIEAKQEPYGTWRGWDRGYGHVDLIKPRVHTMDAMLQPWSPGTGGKDVIGATVLIPVLPDSDAFNKWLPNVKGKFVLMSAPKATCRPHSEWEEVAPPDEVARLDAEQAKITADFGARYSGRGGGGRGTGGGAGRGAGGPAPLTMNDRLERAGAAGVIQSTPIDGWGTYTVGSQWRNKTMPGLTMSCEDYSLLFRMTDQKQNPVVRLNADAKLMGTVPVFNTIATIKGSTKPNEYVMTSAHFDSWDAGTGATDNGTGTIVMLEAMRILRQVYPNPKRTIIAGHWVGEEEGLIGSQAWTYDHQDVVKNLHALFNQDNGTGRIQSTSAVGMTDGAPHLQRWLSQLPLEFQTQVRFSGIGGPATGGTDNASFDCYGSPAFGLSAVSWDYNPYTHHTNRDTFDKIVFDELKGNATIVAMLLYLASEDPQMIAHTRRNLNEPDPLAVAGGGRGGGGRGGRGGRGVDPDAVAGKVTRVGDSVVVTFTLPANGRGSDAATAAAAGGRGGRGGAGGRGGGGGATQPDSTKDAMGWPKTCPQGRRASPEGQQ